MQVRKFLSVVCFLIGCMPCLKAQNMTTAQYIATYKNIAIEEMNRSGVPAAIKLAQGILETQSGNGWLVNNSNNHFGIKCKNNWIGPSVNYDDDARQECFRKYENASASYRDHSNFLRNNPRYAFLFQFGAEDYQSWAYGLKQAGYATSRTYPQQLIKIIEDNNLQDYTLIALGKKSSSTDTQQNEPVYAAAPSTTSPKNDRANFLINPQPPKEYPKGIFEINGRKVLYLPAGTSLIQVADQRDIRLRNLVKYNDLANDAPLTKGMFVFLQKKSKKGKDDYHIVQPGENMHDIAQAEGIQLRWLQRRNKMEYGQEPAAGEKLALDGYASRTPRLRSAAVLRPLDEQHEDFSPRQFVKGIKEEIAKSNNNGQIAEAQPSQQTSNNLPPGMVEDLKKMGTVKPSGPTVPPSYPASTPAPSEPAKTGVMQYHDVQPKETLFAIAKRYNISISVLQEWNNLQGYDIKIGQRLLVGK